MKKASDILKSIRKLDSTKYLSVVNGTTFKDMDTEEYYATTTKGLTRLYDAIGMYSASFVDKLHKLDPTYCDKCINERISTLRNGNVVFVLEQDLRVLPVDTFNLFQGMLESYPDASASVVKDLVTIDDTESFTTYSYVTYHLTNGTLTMCTYEVGDDYFYGMTDYSGKLNDTVMFGEQPFDLSYLVKDQLDYTVPWDVIRKLAKKLKLHDAKTTDILVKAPDEPNAMSDYTVSDMASLIKRAYDNDPSRKGYCIAQFDIVLKSAKPRDDMF